MSTATVEIKFSSEQQEAVEASGSVLVAAAAGSGKTRVLVERIVGAVIDEGLTMQQIVAVTFTRKSAQELRERIAERFMQRNRFELIPEIDRALIGTIDSLCSRIVRNYGLLSAVDPGFQVMDDGMGIHLFESAMTAAIDACSQDSGPEGAPSRIRARYDNRIEDFVKAARQAASQRIDRTVRFVATDEGSTGTADAEYLQRVYEESIRRYSREKRIRNMLDFDDMSAITYSLLQRADVRAAVRSGIARTLVDEFQDTNELQCAIVDAISGDNLFVVGDEWQSIYSFRNADVEVFRQRSNDTPTLRMIDNYRSSPHIIDVVNSTFGSLFHEGYADVSSQAKPERTELPDSTGLKSPVEVLLGIGRDKGTPRSEAEAAMVAERVAALIRSGVAAGDIALLFEHMTNTVQFEVELARRGVPTVRSSSKGFYQQQQVRDALALLTWVANRFDDVAALSVLASPIVGMQWKDLYAVRTAGATIYDGLMSLAETDERCANILMVRDEISAIAENGSIVELVGAVVNAQEYDGVVLCGSDGDRRFANLQKLISISADSVNAGINSVDELLDHIASLAKADRESEALIADENRHAVLLTSIHKSKGLEFPYVFVCNCSNAGKVGAPKALANTDGEILFRHMSDDGSENDPSARLQELLDAEKLRKEDEKKRLFYVAMTRAERYLCISGTFKRKKDGDPTLEGPLKWLPEAMGCELSGDRTSHTHASLPIVTTLYDCDDAVSCTQLESAHDQATMPTRLLAPAAPSIIDELRLSQRRLQQVDVDVEMVGGKVVSSEGQRQRGTDLHAELAHWVQTGSVRTSNVEADIETIIGTPIFAKLRDKNARAEMPYILLTNEGEIESGRFDAVAINDTSWWIVDYKSTLPADEDAAWNLHSEQLERYRAAATAAGATTIRISLVPLDRPHQPVERTL